jgi:hypothetical protein
LPPCPTIAVESSGYGVFDLGNGKRNPAVNVEGGHLPGFPVLKVKLGYMVARALEVKNLGGGLSLN